MRRQTKLTRASLKRVKAFVDSFISGEYVESLTGDRDSDFINQRDRAARCYDAAESGSDGKTHAEVIGDWRDAFESMLQDRRGHEYPERFSAAVNAHFDHVESWHEMNGSLHQEIG
jgi:hypothetical protein